MAATIMDVGQMSGSSAGNALKMIISRYANVKSGAFTNLNLGEDSSDTTEKLNDVEKVLNKIGIDVRDSTLQFRDLDAVLEDLSEKWITLDTVSQNAVATAFAGTRQREAFVTLLNNMDKYHELLKVSEESEGTAEKKNEAYIDSLEASQNRLQNAWESLANNADIRSFMKMVTDLTTKLVKTLPYITSFVIKLLTASQGFKIPKLFMTMFGSWTDGAPGILSAIKSTKRNKGEIFWKAYTGQWKNSIDYYTKEDKSKGIFEKLKQSAETAAEAIDKLGETANDVSNTQTEQTETTNNLNQATNRAIESENAETNSNNQASQSENNETRENIQAAVSEKLETQENRNSAQSEQQKTKGRGLGIGSVFFGAAASGVLAGLSSPTLQEYEDYKGNKAQREMDQSTKIISKVTTGVVTGAFSLINPMLGSVLGTTSELLFKYLSKFMDQESIRRENDLQKAKDILEGLGGIKDSLKTISDISFKQETLDEDLKDLAKAGRDTLNKLLNDTTLFTEMSVNYESLLQNLDENTKEIKDKVVSGNPENFNENLYTLLKKAESGQPLTTQERSLLIQNQNLVERNSKKTALSTEKEGEVEQGLQSFDANWNRKIIDEYLGEMFKGPVTNLTNAQKEAIEIFKTGDTDQINEKIQEFSNQNNWLHIAGGMTGVNTNSSVDPRLQVLLDLTKIKSTKADQITQEREEFKQSIYNRYLNDFEIGAALAKSKNKDENLIIGLSKYQLLEEGGDSLINEIARNWNLDSGSEHFQKVFDENGNINEDLYNDIISYLKNQTEYDYLLNGSEYNLKQISELSTTIGKINKQIVEDAMNRLGVYTQEQLKNKVEEFSKMKLGDFLLNNKELQDKISLVNTLMKDIASGSKTWNDNFQEILKNYPSLIKNMSNQVELQKDLLEYSIQYSKLQIENQFDDIMNNATFFGENIREKIKFSQQGKIWDQLIGYQDFNEVKNLNDLEKWLVKHKDESELTGAINAVNEIITKETSGIQLISDAQKEYLESVISYQQTLLDKQISNLEQQKSMLSEINKQREYENKLIEAKLKLENSYKEKKRVWREGIGWVYAEDQKAIAEAQKEVESLQTERKTAELEKQIKELQEEKSSLENISKEEQLQKQKDLYDAWITKYSDTTGEFTGSIANFVAAVTDKESPLVQTMESFTNKLTETINVLNKEKYLKELQDLLDKNNLTEYQEKIEEYTNNGYLVGTDISKNMYLKELELLLTSYKTTDFNSKSKEYIEKGYLVNKDIEDNLGQKIQEIQEDIKKYNQFKENINVIKQGLAKLIPQKLKKNSSGTINLPSETSTLINELGTEAIITPAGTITALPSRTGIIPADITKNLWKLGELAPNIAKSLYNTSYEKKLDTKSITNDESFNISSLNMNISATETFDVDSFVNSIKTYAALTRNKK